jgi:uncharacterized protein YfbU (UPF0304 family)
MKQLGLRGKQRKNDKYHSYNQYTILQKLSLIQGDEHEAEFYELRAKIVSEGYLYDYYMLTECIADDFSLEDAKLVWDTLDMYSAIYYSYSRIENPKLTSEQIHFEGFDGNYETRSMVYCRFIINELARYTEFKENGYNDYNSHCQRSDKYKAMIEKWNDMGKNYELNEEQIEELIKTY